MAHLERPPAKLIVQAELGSKAEDPFFSATPFLLAWVVFFLFIELVPTLFLARIHIPEKSDFRCFYSGGLLLRTDPSNLYNIYKQRKLQADLAGAENGWQMFIQPPYEALLLAPFSLLPYRNGYLLYLGFNVALIIPCFLVARDAFSNVVDPWQPRPGLLFFFFLPLWLALLQGQASVRLLLLCCGAWHEIRRRRDFVAGLLLALGLFKLQITVPLVLLLVLWRGVRLLAGFAAGASFVTAVSLLLVGWRGLWEFGKLLLTSSLVQGETPSAIAAVGQVPTLMPNLRGLLYGCGGRYLPHLWLLGLTFAISAAVLLLVICLLRRKEDDGAGFALAVIGALLVSYHLHSHDLTLLLLPIALLAGRKRPYFSALVSACFLLPAFLLIAPRQSQYLMAFPLLAFLVLIAQDGRFSFHTTSQSEAVAGNAISREPHKNGSRT